MVLFVVADGLLLRFVLLLLVVCELAGEGEPLVGAALGFMVARCALGEVAGGGCTVGAASVALWRWIMSSSSDTSAKKLRLGFGGLLLLILSLLAAWLGGWG